MNYNEAAELAEEEFGEINWNRINWNDDGSPDVDTNGLSDDEAKKYQEVAAFVWKHTDEE